MDTKFRVNEKTRTVRAYNYDLTDDDFSTVERYTKLGYKVVLIPAKPKAHKPIKNDMITYLEGNIDQKLYDEFIDRIEKKEKFLVTKRWLEKELKARGNDTIDDIINKAKSKEANVIDKIKEQTKADNKKASTSNENSNKSK